jgi:DNA-binding PucR family transcriptional regulator
VNSRLQPLIAHDKKHGTQLIQTLDAHYQARCSPSRTAATLHVHVNTVYYRLNRIRELLGFDFSAPRRALDLQVALLARRLLHHDRLGTISNLTPENSESTHIDGPQSRS